MEAAQTPVASAPLQPACRHRRRAHGLPPVQLLQEPLVVSAGLKPIPDLCAECGVQRAFTYPFLLQMPGLHDIATFGKCMPLDASHFNL
eukprot:6000544-Amphidinium_carterae.1